ncbi:exported hypothetical protein [Candidatus Zixiibacteriota bacterium]|nr:exported hypothetical protein [candidate division Zixibacteria bacterium]
MARKVMLTAFLCLLLSWPASGSIDKQRALATPVSGISPQDIAAAPTFSLADSCIVRNDLGAYWKIDHWLFGAELYKAYQDPSQSCPAPYPFAVQNVNMMLFVNKLCTLYVSVDVEGLDLSVPSCPAPGNLLSISQEYGLVISPPSGGGLYQVSVPLDSSVNVNGPYFVGFYFSNYIDTLAGVALVTDSLQAVCTSYNIWDTTTGFIDLCQNSYYNFPGRLVLFSTGLPGGSGSEPAPSITLLKPGVNEIVSGSATLWGLENSGSKIINYVRFDRKNGTIWSEIGRDSDGTRALRNGVDPSGSGDGYTSPWDYSSLAEGPYWLKATVYDTLGRIAVDSHQAAIDPTPPDLNMTKPLYLDTICLPLKVQATTPDENVTQVKFEWKVAPSSYSISINNLNQASFGDINHNPSDGNHAASGEYGDYYCGPVAGAEAIKYWFDKGFIYGMREGSSYITIDTVVERLAANMHTRANKGTYDDLFYGGMVQYFLTHGNDQKIDVVRRPDYRTIRNLFQEKELFVIMAVSGTPGLYLPLTGVNGLADSQGQYAATVANPVTGTSLNSYIRNYNGGSQFYYNSVWHDIDAVFTLMGYSYTVTRNLIGTDLNGADGWSFDWNSTPLTKDSLYFVTATATDATGRIGATTMLTQYGCKTYIKGDYNDDGLVNIGDAIMLINYVYKKGAAPIGGAYRADANCSGTIDLADIIYVIKYIYSQGTQPCR